MSPEVLGLVMLGLMFVVILGGFPISFTLILLGCVFGYIGLGNRVFHLMTYQVFDTMTDTVLAAVAMFTFMGYVLESAGLMNRLFHAVQLMFGRVHGSLYLATVAVLPSLFIRYGGFSQANSRALGGTSVLIAVGVALDTMRQMESQMMMRNYEGFLK